MKENRLVVGDVGWADTIPDWLLEEVKSERVVYGLASIMRSDGEKVGDAEVCVYLYTAGWRQPLDHYQTEVYIYLTAKLMDKRGNKELPDFMGEKLKKGLSQDEDRELNSLRSMIYRKRGGEINHPLLNAMRGLKKEVEKDTRKLAEMEEVGQKRLEVFS